MPDPLELQLSYCREHGRTLGGKLHRALNAPSAGHRLQYARQAREECQRVADMLDEILEGPTATPKTSAVAA